MPLDPEFWTEKAQPQPGDPQPEIQHSESASLKAQWDSQFASLKALWVNQYAIGTKVYTTNANSDYNGWSKSVTASRKWGVKGTVVERYGNKNKPEEGIVYEVLHDGDDTTTLYMPEELTYAPI